MYSESLDPIVRQQEAQREAQERASEFTRGEEQKTVRATAITTEAMSELFADPQNKRAGATFEALRPPQLEALRDELRVRQDLADKQLLQRGEPTGPYVQQALELKFLEGLIQAKQGMESFQIMFDPQTGGFSHYLLRYDWRTEKPVATKIEVPPGVEPIIPGDLKQGLGRLRDSLPELFTSVPPDSPQGQELEQFREEMVRSLDPYFGQSQAEQIIHGKRMLEGKAHPWDKLGLEAFGDQYRYGF
jgi:hypothetical protein